MGQIAASNDIGGDEARINFSSKKAVHFGGEPPCIGDGPFLLTQTALQGWEELSRNRGPVSGLRSLFECGGPEEVF
jgi:hypothetical protein